MPRRRSEPSTAARIVSGRLSRSIADLLAALEAEAEFGGDDQSVALAFERLADQFLVLEGTVGLGRIQEGAAKLDGAMQRGDRLAFVRRTVGLAHRHAAETDRGDLQSLAA